MLTLCGFSASNYYNKVKLALMEKRIPFEEELAWLGQTHPDESPLGKVPYLRTRHGAISESDAIIEYVDTLSPTTPLLPADPFAAAKVRELCVYLNLHLELVARNLYPQAFFGGKVSDATRDKTLEQLRKNIAAFAKIARFDTPFIAGEQFSLADCSAIVHLPLISSATKIMGGTDLLAELPVRDYLTRMGERPAVQKLNADRKANTVELMEHMQAKAAR
ncbi:MAG: glutathione S-transferase [Comamonas sp.]|nr:glutathione S-transferase [Comamonas sp.]